MAAGDEVLDTIEPTAGKTMPPAARGVDDALLSVGAAASPLPPPSPLPLSAAPMLKTGLSQLDTLVPNLETPSLEPLSAAAPPSAPPQVSGPVTPALIVQAGLPQQEAADWAALANWMTAGEAHDFGQLYGTEKFTDFSAHPADKGWSGGVGPDGRPTHAAGLFQDEPDTWHKIAQQYGVRDFSATSQVSGNLRFAADLYKQRTGRSLLADFKAGNTASIASQLHDQWPSLDGGQAAGGSEAVDRRYVQVQMEGIDRISKQIDKLAEEASREPAGSAERHEKLRRAMDHSEELQRRYEKLSEKPPQPMSPLQAAGEMTPLMVALVTLAGTFTRQPALGAMNALGSALGALKQGNDENYKHAVDLWSKQTDHAAKAFSLQNEEIDTIMRDQQLSEKERQDRLQNSFRVLGLKSDLELAKTNAWDKIYKRQEDRKKLAADLEEKAALTKEHLARASQLAAGGTQPTMVEYQKAKAAFVAQNNREPSEVEDKQLFEEAIAKTRGASGGRRGTEQGYIDDALQAKAEERGVSLESLTAGERRDATRQAHQEWAQASSEGRAAGSSSPFNVALRANVTDFVARNKTQPTDEQYQQIVEKTISEVKGQGHVGTEQGYINTALQERAAQKGIPIDQLSASDRREVVEQAHGKWAQVAAEGRAAGAPETAYRKAIEAQMSAAKRARGESGALNEAEKAQAAKEAATFKHKQVGITGNLQVHLQQEQLQYAEGLNTVNDIMELMDKHGMIAGLGGRILRGKELISDILGFGGSDYYDFARKIEMLQNWANGLLQQRASGRQLSAQENRIADIVPGLGLGQPADRVYPAMLDLQKIFTDMFMLRDQQLKGQVPTFTPPIAAGGTGVLGPSRDGGVPTSTTGSPTPPPSGVRTTIAPGFELYPEAR